MTSAPRRSRGNPNVAVGYSEGKTQEQLREAYAADASNPTITDDQILKEYGDPDLFHERRGDVVPYKAFRYVNYVDQYKREYALVDPTPQEIAAEGFAIVRGQPIRLKYKIGRTLNLRERLMHASEVPVYHPEEKDILVLMVAPRANSVNRVLRNMQALVTANDSNRQRSTGVIDTILVDFV